VFLQLPIHRKTALTQKKNITELLHNRLQEIKYKKGMFLSFNHDYSYFSQDLMICSTDTVGIPDIRAFLKIISGRSHQKSGHVREFRTHGNPKLTCICEQLQLRLNSNCLDKVFSLELETSDLYFVQYLKQSFNL